MTAERAAHYQHLFSEITLGRKKLRNRVAFPATLANYAQQHAVTDRMIDFYRARAEGGAGMIITEGLSVHESSMPQPAVVTLFEDANFDGLQRLAAAVESNDCRMVGQLWHVGRQQLWNPVASPVGVSEQPDALSWSVPHVLSIDDIRRIVDSYAAGARRLQQAGFSGAELHGAHGYLITQFLSPWSNTRTDVYGGDLEGRTRFVREIMEAVRSEVGSDFILGLKMPGEEGVKGGIDPDEAERILKRLRPLGQLDYIAFSQGNFGLSLEDHVPDMHYARGPFLDIHKRLRASADGLPVMAVGRVVSAEHADAVVASGTADLVAMSRALVSDAALPMKARAGRTADIRPCIFCNVCWAEIHAGKPMACIHNPRLAQPDEVSWRPVRVTRKRRVTVVGAGVGGLEAAWVAASRGNEVTVLGASSEAGGKARLEAALPGRQETALVYQHQLTRAAEFGVKLNLGREADLAAVLATRPDAVVLATGSRMRLPGTLEAGSNYGISLREWAANPASHAKASGTAVLFDHDHSPAVYAAADQLAKDFARVVLVTPRLQLARGVAYVSTIGIYRRLYTERVELVLGAVPVRFEDGVFTHANVFTGERTAIADVALFTYATPRLVNDGLAAGLRAAGIETHLVGDCFSPRAAMAAIHEGSAVGARI